MTELTDGAEYAVLLYDKLRLNWNRPLRGVWDEARHRMKVYYPDDPDVAEEHSLADLVVEGGWRDKCRNGGDLRLTWRGYAAQQYAQVLRQRELAQRLTDFGIPREPEPYIITTDAPNAIERSMVLNFNELHKLLRGAGF